VARKPPHLGTDTREEGLSKKTRREKVKDAKSRPVDGIAEAPGLGRDKPLVLGEGAAEAALCRVRRALEEQDAERRAYNGLKSVGCGAVAPKPTLVLSGVDELVPPFRNGSSGADEEFRKYFIHPAVAMNLDGPEISALIPKSDELTVGQRYAALHGMATSPTTPSQHELLRGENAELDSRMKSMEVYRPPHAPGNEDTDQSRPLNECSNAQLTTTSPTTASHVGIEPRRPSNKECGAYQVSDTELEDSDNVTENISSDYCSTSEDGGVSADRKCDNATSDVPHRNDQRTPLWHTFFPEGMEMDERCYRSVGAALPFRTVSLPKRPLQPPAAGSTPCMSSPCIAAPCVVAPMDRVRYRGAHAGGADDAAGPESTQSLCERVDAPGRHGDGAVSVPRGSVVGDDGPEYTRLLTKALNSGDGTALDHFATALCQVVKPAALTDGPPAVPTPDTEFLHSSWALEVKDTYTWYSGYDVVHGMSYVHPLVLHDFVPVHPLYHGDSPRVKWQGPIGRLPRMDPSKDYLRASLQYLRACAVKVGRLPSPPMQVQKLVARQYHQFESMLDRIREVRRVHQPGGGPTHKNVHVNEMIARKDILLAPLLFSPRHLLVGDDPSHQSERDHGFLRRNFTRVTPGMCDIVDGSASQGTSRAREPIVTLYDKDLEQPLYRGKRPLRMNDMPPPYPVFRREQYLARKVVYRTRAPEPEASAAPGDSAANGGAKSAEPPSKKSKGPLPPPRPAPPVTRKEQNLINRREERELRAHERRMRLRAEMGEEAWAAEQRRKEEHLLQKKVQYQTTKKCKDAIEWIKGAAKFPTIQTFNQHMVMERAGRAIKAISHVEAGRKKVHDAERASSEKVGGVLTHSKRLDTSLEGKK
jgi:hypothetical protein